MRGWLADKEFPDVAKYIHRTCYLLSQGTPAARIALLYPTSSIWLGDNGKDKTALEVMQELLKNQHDFDVTDERSIESLMALQNGSFLNRSGQPYTAVIIPPVSALSERAISRLNEFEKSGGKVICLGNKPVLTVDKTFLNAPETHLKWAVNEPSGKVTPAVLKALPPQDFVLDKPCEFVKYTHRKWKDADLYFVFNEGDVSVDLNVTLAGKGRIQGWDAMTGQISRIPGKKLSKDRVITRLNLEPRETRFIVVGGNAH
jgi:hypothetical protein